MADEEWTLGDVVVDAKSLQIILDLASDVADRTAEESSAMFAMWHAIGGAEAALECAHVGQTHLDGEPL